MRLFQVYSPGNFIEATPRRPSSRSASPARQAGARPRDHARDPARRGRQVRAGLDGPTLKSNLSVGLPLDMAVYEVDKLESDKIVCIDENNPYFRMVRNDLGPEAARGVRRDRAPGLGRHETEVPLLMPSSRNKPLKKIANAREKLI